MGGEKDDLTFIVVVSAAVSEACVIMSRDE